MMVSYLEISRRISIPLSEVEISAVRSQGAGGQHVNKTATAIHLRFDIKKSSLPDFCKERLLRLNDQRINAEGIIIIKSQQERSQYQNKLEALQRLRALVKSVLKVPKPRKATKPTKSSQEKRLDRKKRHSHKKSTRRKVNISMD